jgi:NAD(P) transhydrogenase subunit alpha
MIIAVLKETRAEETRVAATPDTVKRLAAAGAELQVQAGAGSGASISDAAFEAAGAKIVKDRKALMGKADIVLGVKGPDDVAAMKKGAVLAAMLDPYDRGAELPGWAEAGITAFAMELMPRITRAQSMDVLSSQSNLAGYRAVIDAAAAFDRAFPMMMTAAGTVAPAKVVVLGAGVAGLQAIATARRMGAVVSAFDVRLAAREQVQSLGAKFIEVEGAEDLETKAGYAKEASDEFKKKQRDKIAETLKKSDIVISTALIPGRPAPVLIDEDMVKDMGEGSVIVDLAVERGGNCVLSEAGKTVVKHGVKILGALNVPGRVARDASQLYAKNLVNFLSPLFDKATGGLKLDFADEILSGTCLVHGGAVVHERFKSAAPAEEKPKSKPRSKKKSEADEADGAGTEG